MFNIFPKYGSLGDSITSEELTNKNNNCYPTWTWTTGIKDADGKDISVTDLISKYNTLLGENKILKEELKSIEEDGTEEHNEAVKLRQENAQLKVKIDEYKEIFRYEEFSDSWKTQYDQEVVKNTKLEDKVKELENEIKNWRTGVMHWKNLYDEKANYISDLVKEVIGLRHLKEENVKLIERNRELLEKYNGTVTMGGLKYMEAKLQIVQNNYKKCSAERDEYKHQLNAANKEIEVLKSKVRDWEDKYAQSYSYNDMDKLQKEIDQLKRWKKEQLTVQSWWDKVDSYVRDHDDAPLGGIVANTCLNFLKERDELKANAEKLNLQITALQKIIEGGKKTIDEQKEEIKKLKEDIVDYVIEKDDKLKEAEETIDTLKNMKTQGFEDYDPRDFEPQKHPMYPIHWSGYDGAASAHPEQYSKWLNEQRDKAIAEKKQKDVEFNAEELLKRVTEYAETTAENLEEKFNKGEDVLDYFEKSKWVCPCNKCKDKRENKKEKSWEEAASDLALSVVKLEKQIEELKLINVQIPYSSMNPDGTLKTIPCNISTSDNNSNIKGTI